MKLLNPKSFFARFVLNFALGYSAVGLVAIFAWAFAFTDALMALATPLAFGVLFGLVRAAIFKPGTPFMDSPIRHFSSD